MFNYCVLYITCAQFRSVNCNNKDDEWMHYSSTW